MGILVRGGRVIDAASRRDEITDVYVSDGKIQAIGRDLKIEDPSCQVISAE